ncbi:RimJ/RimL family protein N-acetyltransferase [Hydrogenispora ethanolica]|uniref:RimJ/RimL family protein N-acetyltransferase n=1 Tax=Hydrogenispora ethanolica TaxID=1082276 RepID=A0A4R1RD96_HYDET|nr:GNAT family N-acetyltransferase [Hydrogenispora ethanolica]TCL63769.1 RimJ/RimL family protein N-acetyltransferase [Hydrogenispora ethanolica]
MMVTRIATGRLILIPFTRRLASSLLDGNSEELLKLALNVHDAWPDTETLETLPKIIKNLEAVPEPTGFESWIIVKREGMIGIGDAGFKGLPNAAGEVDIGYSIIAPEWRKGYGYEAARALLDWAFTQPGVRAVTAECLTDNRGSARILEKLGMSQLGREDGMIHWRVGKPGY